MNSTTTIRVTIENNESVPYIDFVFDVNHNSDTVFTGNVQVGKQYGGIMDIVNSILKKHPLPPTPNKDEP